MKGLRDDRGLFYFQASRFTKYTIAQDGKLFLVTQKVAVALAAVLVFSAAQAEPGFVSLFDGKSLDGWQIVGQKGSGYIVEKGLLVCPADGGGNLFTTKEYANFILRFEFRLFDGSNNGIGRV